MTGFSADWLALRAPADAAARDGKLVEKLCDWAVTRQGALSIADYGGGTGAGLAALSPRLPSEQQWRILDNDAALLARIPGRDGVETVVANLAAAPEIGMNPVPDLVTGFAFFDLVSAAWIDRLVPLIAKVGAAVYAPLTYDGVEVWAPTPPHEAQAAEAFIQDMRRDKGFGPALGAGATSYLLNALQAAGYDVTTALTPWELSRPRDGALMDALAEGGAKALSAVLPADELAEWADGRRAANTASIGHFDLLALPPK